MVLSYRRRPDRNTAFCEYRGERIHFRGKYGSAESLATYERFCQAVADGDAATIRRISLSKTAKPMTVGRLIDRYLEYAKGYYSYGEYHNVLAATAPLKRLCGNDAVTDFGPIRLKHVREAGVTGSWLKRPEDAGRRPWSRTTANKYAKILIRMFRWGAEEELFPASVAAALEVVRSLRKGKTVGAEGQKVSPIAQSVVDATLPSMSPQVADMVQIQLLAAMRPQGVYMMRPCDIDRSGVVWLYVPVQHKQSHLDMVKIICLGPKCQQILLPYLDRNPEQWCFIGQKGNRFNHNSYMLAIHRACKRAGIPRWSPNRLRHSAATQVAARYDLDSARCLLGHGSVTTTMIYAQRDLETASKIALEIG